MYYIVDIDQLTLSAAIAAEFQGHTEKHCMSLSIAGQGIHEILLIYLLSLVCIYFLSHPFAFLSLYSYG